MCIKLLLNSGGTTPALVDTWNIGTFAIAFQKFARCTIAICGAGYNRTPINVAFVDKTYAKFSTSDINERPSIMYVVIGQ